MSFDKILFANWDILIKITYSTIVWLVCKLRQFSNFFVKFFQIFLVSWVFIVVVRRTNFFIILAKLTPLFNFLLASISSFSISIVNSFNVFYILDSYKLSLCISYYYNYSKKFLIWNSFTSLGNTLDLFITTLTYIFSGLL